MPHTSAINDNLILIEGLDLAAHIGVPEMERAEVQTLRADIAIRPRLRFEDMEDRIERTIDYDAVARRMRALAAERPRHLIETLAADLAGEVLGKFGAAWVSVTIRKRILPGTDAVTVRIERSNSQPAGSS